jgi:mannosylglucosylglycerate synthase
MNNIALCHFRTGETDGVSLEMEKWKTVLEHQGHSVTFISGNQDSEACYLIPELHYANKINLEIFQQAYQERTISARELEHQIETFAQVIQQKLEAIIKESSIDCIIPNNIFSLGFGLSAAIAIKKAVENTGIKCICHHHDFYWERDNYKNPTCSFVSDMLEQFFPPVGPNFKHVVINSLAQTELKKRKKLPSTIVPNVLDFQQPVWKIDDYNRDLGAAIGVDANDIIILQATRVSERKAIELAIDFVEALNKPYNLYQIREKGLYDGRPFGANNRIQLLLAGLIECELGYLDLLIEKARLSGIDLLLINDFVEMERSEKEGKKIYALTDCYAIADFVTYPSVLEGWGNQFLEAIFARKPILIYEYPVYEADLKKYNFTTSSLSNKHQVTKNGLITVNSEKIKQSAQQAVEILTNQANYQSLVKTNFEKGKALFSYDNLSQLLATL